MGRFSEWFGSFQMKAKDIIGFANSLGRKKSLLCVFQNQRLPKIRHIHFFLPIK